LPRKRVEYGPVGGGHYIHIDLSAMFTSNSRRGLEYARTASS
jgi:hypothetical protein